MFKAGFIFGGEGGDCVLLARAGNGTWSYPAFYGMGSGSFGFQIGIQDSAVRHADHDEPRAECDPGQPVQDRRRRLDRHRHHRRRRAGITTAALGADIVAFSQSRGLYGGVSLEGSVLGSRTDWNHDYYGQAFAARQIVMAMQGANPGADPLRAVLTRYGAGEAQQASVPAPAYQPPPGDQSPPPYQSSADPPGYGAPTQLGPVQQQSLPPPR